MFSTISTNSSSLSSCSSDWGSVCVVWTDMYHPLKLNQWILKRFSIKIAVINIKPSMWSANGLKSCELLLLYSISECHIHPFHHYLAVNPGWSLWSFRRYLCSNDSCSSFPSAHILSTGELSSDTKSQQPSARMTDTTVTLRWLHTTGVHKV